MITNIDFLVIQYEKMVNKLVGFTEMSMPIEARKALLELVDCGLKGDPDSFDMSRRILAKKLKSFDENLALEINKKDLSTDITRGVSVIPSPVDADSRQQLLIEEYFRGEQEEPIWSDLVKRQLVRVVKEHGLRKKLLEEGLMPTRSVLFEGPPGVGKTLSARWIASELNLPLYTLDLSTVMSSYLGKTGNNIRSVLKYAQERPCVLLLDEFDSIAKRRNDDSDVGELKRLVTVLLQAIDDWPHTSVLVAATNHGELLDPAVWRRFDVVLTLDMPSPEAYMAFLLKKQCSMALADWLSVRLQGVSLAVLEKKIHLARKNALLDKASFNKELIELLDLNVEEFLDSGVLSDRDVQILRLHQGGLSQRKISEELDISRPTVKKVIDANKE